jgi:hypothetical protein
MAANFSAAAVPNITSVFDPREMHMGRRSIAEINEVVDSLWLGDAMAE